MCWGRYSRWTSARLHIVIVGLHDCLELRCGSEGEDRTQCIVRLAGFTFFCCSILYLPTSRCITRYVPSNVSLSIIHNRTIRLCGTIGLVQIPLPLLLVNTLPFQLLSASLPLSMTPVPCQFARSRPPCPFSHTTVDSGTWVKIPGQLSLRCPVAFGQGRGCGEMRQQRWKCIKL